MTIAFPSRAFDDAAAAVCHGVASQEQTDALWELLRGDALARDEYLLRVAIHAHLASEPGLFSMPAADAMGDEGTIRLIPAAGSTRDDLAPKRPARVDRWWRLALAACLLALLSAAWWLRSGDRLRRPETSRAVAMLNRAVHAQWNGPERSPRLGAPLEPGTLRLDAGLAQIVFYSGARVAIEGPAELRLVSSTEVVCDLGTLTAEVPPQARGFRVMSPRLEVTDLGTAFGLKVNGDRSELHVFEGSVEVRAHTGATGRNLEHGKGALVVGEQAPLSIRADPAAFADLFDLQAKSVAADAQRYDRWRESIRRLQRDPSLWVHLDFEHGGAPDWRLHNAGSRGTTVPDATIVGCEWREGRWPTKPALEFRGISDRVRMQIPGDLESVTLAAWVRVQGLDRQINSLCMSDGFLPRTLHWVIRNDGVLGLTVIGETRNHQIVVSPPVMAMDQFGIWTHLAVVVDGRARQVTHYVNGQSVSRHRLQIDPPFHLGAAELGNWNALGYPGHHPFLIRNFSGAVDEFCVFNRALAPDEIRSLHADGKPQPGALAASKPKPHASHLHHPPSASP